MKHSESACGDSTKFYQNQMNSLGVHWPEVYLTSLIMKVYGKIQFCISFQIIIMELMELTIFTHSLSILWQS